MWIICAFMHQNLSIAFSEFTSCNAFKRLVQKATTANERVRGVKIDM